METFRYKGMDVEILMSITSIFLHPFLIQIECRDYIDFYLIRNQESCRLVDINKYG